MLLEDDTKSEENGEKYSSGPIFYYRISSEMAAHYIVYPSAIIKIITVNTLL